jgi:hypothetical protein
MKFAEYDLSTDNLVIRDATAEEIAAINAQQAELVEQEAEAAARTADREALLDRLGITEAEAQLLLGGM